MPFAFCLARAAESTGTHPGGRNAEPSLRCQCLLIFVQRYKFELTKEHIDAIKEICKVAACEHTVAQPYTVWHPRLPRSELSWAARGSPLWAPPLPN